MMVRSAAVFVAGILAASAVGCDVRPSASPGPSKPISTRGPVATIAAGPDLDAAMAARLGEALANARDELGAPGAQAAIVLADGTMWTGASGVSASGSAMSSDLLLAIGSVTKVYTSTLILGLTDEGILTLDDPLLRWVPDAPNGAGVTIRQLLTHTSGIASDDPALPPVCDPGTCYSYSNGGYQLLGRVIEAATGGTYAASMHARITASRGLASTFYPREEDIDGLQAMGHRAGEDLSAVDAATFAHGPGWLGASGGIVATAADLAQFGHALGTGTVLSPASLAALTDTTATQGLPGASECQAAAMVDRRGTPYGTSWSHGGNTGWFRAWLEHWPEQGLTIAVLTNSNDFPGPIADRLAATILENVPTATPAGHCEDAIAVRAPDGAVRRFADAPGFDGMPAWSPDGKSVAWLAFHDERADILVAGADGSGVRNITANSAPEVRVSWSPDGSRIVFASKLDGDFELYALRVADGTTKQLTNNDIDDFVPAWSPDGERIAYVRTDGANQLRVIGADGTSDRPVDGAEVGAWWPVWSPGSDRLAYETGGAIYIVPAAGGIPTRFAVERLRVVRFPTWAPSADLAFVSDGDVYAAAPDGSNLRRLTVTPTEESTPAWGPDGSLAFQLSFWAAR